MRKDFILILLTLVGLAYIFIFYDEKYALRK